ncbi:RNA polymerase sigma factor [Demequina lutea]|uniref:RNA polymerase sigma-70 factor (ECF subfamily) n=1 Tax=Demequina lutea TaxID=431489 RepID=A0A7Y9ZDB6_9MICO|nr:RNA polymerase sigma factor [Demequina lutea]NYI42158.1 RNA polymerase sigma-70 factor (ECF subfamily) [Demequina lutea]
MTDGNDAVADALRANAADLLRYLQRRVGDEAPDVLGETMLVAWRRGKDMPADATQARMWLFGIARMAALGHGRDASRRLRLAVRLHGLVEPVVWPDDDIALDVQQAIASLPEEQAELVRLVHWEGFSLADAAHVMGLNASTARGRYQQARLELAMTLQVSSR